MSAAARKDETKAGGKRAVAVRELDRHERTIQYVSTARETGSAPPGRNSTLEMAVGLKDIGSKTRARLEEEKQKRPEIRVLDHAPGVDTQKNNRAKATSFSSNIAAQKGPSGNSKLKRKRAGQVGKPRASRALVPDVSHLEVLDKENLSTMVRMHGLPEGCTSGHVKKFFAGIDALSVSTLLPNNTRIYQLDSRKPLPGTLDCGQTRVVVEFHAIAATILASERSGEFIRIQPNGDQEEKGHDFAVVVTVLDKAIARALEPLRVPSVAHHVPFDVTLREVMGNNLHPSVPKILWSATALKLSLSGYSLPLDESIEAARVALTQEDETRLWDTSKTKSWRSHLGYQRSIEHYNRLVDMQDEILHNKPLPVIEVSKPGWSLEQNLALNLSTLALKALATEMDRIEALLFRARAFYTSLDDI